MKKKVRMNWKREFEDLELRMKHNSQIDRRRVEKMHRRALLSEQLSVRLYRVLLDSSQTVRGGVQWCRECGSSAVVSERYRMLHEDHCKVGTLELAVNSMCTRGIEV